jgi:hypothetical protein
MGGLMQFAYIKAKVKLPENTIVELDVIPNLDYESNEFYKGWIVTVVAGKDKESATQNAEVLLKRLSPLIVGKNIFDECVRKSLMEVL